MTKIKGIRKWAQNIDRNKEDAPPAVLMHFIKLAGGKEKEKKEKREEKEKMQVTIIGIKKGETKNQKVFYNYYGLKQFSDYDMENAECTGQEPVTAFSYKDYNVQVGDLVDFRYEPGYQGQATLSDIIMVSPNTPFDTKEKKDSK